MNQAPTEHLQHVGLSNLSILLVGLMNQAPTNFHGGKKGDRLLFRHPLSVSILLRKSSLSPFLYIFMVSKGFFVGFSFEDRVKGRYNH